MNISIINSSDIGGGAEKVNLRLNQYYNNNGHNSRMYVGKKLSNSKDIIQIKNDKYENIWVKINKRLSRNTKFPFNNFFKMIGVPNWRSEQLGREPMYYPATKNIILSKRHRPDILHLGNLHGKYFDLRQLPIISTQIPTVLRLSDMWMLTGHCAHSLDCERWMIGCGHCPDLSLYPAIIKDATKNNYTLKKRICEKSKLFISTPSNWLMEKVKKSILKNSAIETRVIPTGIDLDFYKPGDKNLLRNGLRVDHSKIVIIVYASGHKAYKWEGVTKFLNIFKKYLSCKYGTIIYVIGQDCKNEKFEKTEINYIPYINDKKEYRKYLQLSDIYVHMSTADTYPNSIMEALSCGLPSIAFEIGGIPEQIIPFNNSSKYFNSNKKPTGILVPKDKYKEMVNLIEEFISDKKLRLKISNNAFCYSKLNFDFNRFANTYLNWYGEILSLA